MESGRGRPSLYTILSPCDAKARNNRKARTVSAEGHLS